MGPFETWFFTTFPNKYVSGMTYEQMAVIARDEIEKMTYNVRHLIKNVEQIKEDFNTFMTISYIPVSYSETQKEKLDGICSNGSMSYLMLPILPATFEDMNYRDLFLNMI